MPEIYEPVLIVGDRSKLQIAESVRIDSFVKIEIGNGMIIGDGVHIASFSHIGIGGGVVVLKDGASVGSGGKVLSGSATLMGETLSAAMPEKTVLMKAETVIGKNATVLVNAIVLPGVTLGEGAVLAAGGVATKDIPAFEIWGGVPAKKLGERKHHAEIQEPADG